MRVYAAQAAKAIDCDTNAFEIRKLNPSIVTNHYVFNMPAAIDERADLPPYLVRQLRKLAREFRSQNLMRGDAPGVKFFYAAKLIRLEARGVSYYVLDGSCPPVTLLTTTSTESWQLRECITS